jgi:hypothetical protein
LLVLLSLLVSRFDPNSEQYRRSIYPRASNTKQNPTVIH